MIKSEDISIINGHEPVYLPPPRYDLLRLPLLGRVLRSKRGRLWLQIPLLLIAIVLIYDGFTGPKLAPQNLAASVVWIQYRGLVMLALLLVGNLFCMGCPFTIPRTIAMRVSGRGRRWPRALRNKWPAVIFFVAFLFLYEWLDLWSSPALTAWLIIGYFIGAFALEALFAESPFCKYICPLGTFNFIASTASPTHVTVRDRDICRTCAGKECVNGSNRALGCGTELFPPALQSNLDCVFCLDCARACPYDNVALAVRPPGHELIQRAWSRRWDLSFLILVFAFASLSNAFGMVPPFYELASWLSGLIGTTNEFILLGLIFTLLNLILPGAVGLGAAWLSRSFGNAAEPLRVSFSRFAPAFVPLAFAVWLAHYGFHFSTGALTIVPIAQNFLLDHGLPWFGTAPNWELGKILPGNWILPLQTIIVLIGFGLSLYVGNRISRRDFSHPAIAVRVLLPWIVVFFLMAVAALTTFNLPMEMRGTIFLGG